MGSGRPTPRANIINAPQGRNVIPCSSPFKYSLLGRVNRIYLGSKYRIQEIITPLLTS